MIDLALSQTEMLKRHFDQGLDLTVGEALTRFGIYALSQRCGELKAEGYPVISEMVTLPNRKRIARYRKCQSAYLKEYT